MPKKSFMPASSRAGASRHTVFPVNLCVCFPSFLRFEMELKQVAELPGASIETRAACNFPDRFCYIDAFTGFNGCRRPD
jgi:hypothetical protein